MFLYIYIYIAGQVAYKLKKIIDCDGCLEMFIDHNIHYFVSDENLDFINEVNMGKLTYPLNYVQQSHAHSTITKIQTSVQ